MGMFRSREDMPGTHAQAEITGMEGRRWTRGSREAERLLLGRGQSPRTLEGRVGQGHARCSTCGGDKICLGHGGGGCVDWTISGVRSSGSALGRGVAAGRLDARIWGHSRTYSSRNPPQSPGEKGCVGLDKRTGRYLRKPEQAVSWSDWGPGTRPRRRAKHVCVTYSSPRAPEGFPKGTQTQSSSRILAS